MTTARHLTLAKGLTLPIDVVTQKLAWLGVTGSGKTYGASKLFELLVHAGAQSVVIDPVGVWWGVRLDKSGKKPSTITVPIFGGLHGDVPLEPTGGALLANLIVDRALSAVVDVSQFESDAAKARFAADFADRLFQRRKAAPAALHLFLEECQEFVPQNPQRGDERMLHVFTRMQKLGRNYGIGSSYISQRPQEVNKKALNMAQTLFVFRTTGVHERKAIEAWVHDKALDQDIADDLPKIATGHCHVWSPEFLSISKQVGILEKETFNASATPEVGAAAVTRELAPIDLAQIAKDMAATIERAKEEDPRELRKQIADLKKQAASTAISLPPERKAVSTPILTDADRALLNELRDRLIGRTEAIADKADVMLNSIGERAKAAVAATVSEWLGEVAGHRREFERVLDLKGFQKILDKLATYNSEHKTPVAPTAPRSPLAGRVDRAPSTSTPARQVSAPRPVVTGDLADDRRLVDKKGALKKHVRLFMTSLAHQAGLSREQFHLLNGYVPSGDTSSGLNALVEQGLVDRSGDRFELTTAGRAWLGPVDPPLAGRALQDRALASAQSSAERKILSALFDAHPHVSTRAEIHDAVGLKPSGDTSRALNKGITLGWILERDGGYVAADHFFGG